MKNKFDFKNVDKIFIEDLNNLSDKTKLNKLSNWDSLKQLELVSLLEKKLKKKLSIKEIIKIKTISDLKKLDEKNNYYSEHKDQLEVNVVKYFYKNNDLICIDIDKNLKKI